MPAAGELSAAGEFDDLFRFAFGFGLAGAIRQPHDRVGIADVDIFWLWPGRMKGDAERFLEIVDEDFVQLWFPVAIRIAQHPQTVRFALADEEVAIRRGDDDARLSEVARELGNLKSGGRFRPSAFGTLH